MTKKKNRTIVIALISVTLLVLISIGIGTLITARKAHKNITESFDNLSEMDSETGVSAPALYKDSVIFLHSDGFIQSFDKKVGKFKWKKKVVKSTKSINEPMLITVAQELVVLGDSLYFVAQDKLYAFDLKRKQIKWEKSYLDEGVSLPAGANNTIFKTIEKTLVAFDAKTGNKKWTFKNNDHFVSARPVPTESFVYLTDLTSILAINVKNGKKVWQYKLKFGEPNEDPVLSNGKLYEQTLTGKNEASFEVVDANTGQYIFNKKIKNDAIMSLVAISDNLLCFAGENYFYMLESNDGKEIWKTKTDSITNPIISEGKVYLLDSKGLRSFNAKTGKHIWTRALKVKISDELEDGGFTDQGQDEMNEFVIDENLIYISAGQRSKGAKYDVNYVYAVDKNTGEIRWKK